MLKLQEPKPKPQIGDWTLGFGTCNEMAEGIQVARLISTTQLNTLLHLHLWPIKPVIYR